MTNTPTWEERFDEQFPYFAFGNKDGTANIDSIIVKAFISSIVQETEERVRGEMREKLQEKKQEYLSKLSTKHVTKQTQQDKIILIMANQMDIAELFIP